MLSAVSAGSRCTTADTPAAFSAVTLVLALRCSWWSPGCRCKASPCPTKLASLSACPGCRCRKHALKKNEAQPLMCRGSQLPGHTHTAPQQLPDLTQQCASAPTHCCAAARLPQSLSLCCGLCSDCLRRFVLSTDKRLLHLKQFSHSPVTWFRNPATHLVLVSNFSVAQQAGSKYTAYTCQHSRGWVIYCPG